VNGFGVLEALPDQFNVSLRGGNHFTATLTALPATNAAAVGDTSA